MELQAQVEPFEDVAEALRRQQAVLGIRILVFSDVERRFLDLYLQKLPGFKPNFVGSTEEARIQKPNPRVYRWVLRRVGLEERGVLYCAGPQFDVQGAMAAGLKAAWVRRPEGRLDMSEGDVAPDYEVQDLLELTELLAARMGRWLADGSGNEQSHRRASPRPLGRLRSSSAGRGCAHELQDAIQKLRPAALRSGGAEVPAGCGRPRHRRSRLAGKAGRQLLLAKLT